MSDLVKKILVVDDDVDFLNHAQDFLKNLGYEVIVAETQAEAENLMAGTEFDGAVINLGLEYPDSGFTLCYHAKKLPKPFPIIMLTGANSYVEFEFNLDSPSTRQWIKADVYLEKPIRMEQIATELEHLLR
ncbi:MAG: response regulator [Planctomycetia bacterium]|nr:response regulator [Planctomycetia bacterium]